MDAMRHLVETVVPVCGTGAVPVRDLDAIVGEQLAPMPVRWGVLDDVLGATLAQPIAAGTALPPADTAAMDGYAVNGAGPMWMLRAQVRVAGRAPPGSGLRGPDRDGRHDAARHDRGVARGICPAHPCRR